LVHDQLLRPTQPSTLSGMEIEYRPKCGDAVRLWGVKAGKGQIRLHYLVADRSEAGRRSASSC